MTILQKTPTNSLQLYLIAVMQTDEDYEDNDLDPAYLSVVNKPISMQICEIYLYATLC